MIGSLIPPQHRLLAALLAATLALTAAAVGGYRLRGMSATAELERLKRTHADQVTAAVKATQAAIQQALDDERTLRATAERIADEERTRSAAAQAVLADLAGQSDRLRHDLRRYAAARTCIPSPTATPADRSPPPPGAPLVPGDIRDELLTEAAAALRQLAPALDDARAAHTACAAIYDAARLRLARIGPAGRDLERVPP